MPLARVTGPVLTTAIKTGTSRPREGQSEGRPYRMTFVRVLVEDQDITEVQLPDEMPVPRQGELADYLVDLSTYGGRLSCRVSAEYPAENRKAA